MIDVGSMKSEARMQGKEIRIMLSCSRYGFDKILD